MYIMRKWAENATPWDTSYDMAVVQAIWILFSRYEEKKPQRYANIVYVVENLIMYNMLKDFRNQETHFLHATVFVEATNKLLNNDILPNAMLQSNSTKLKKILPMFKLRVVLKTYCQGRVQTIRNHATKITRNFQK